MGAMDTRIDRRDFLKSTTTAAAAAGFMIVSPEAVRGTAANSAVQLGIIGCGGRGTSVASSMMENTNLRVAAIADVFQDRLEAGNLLADLPALGCITELPRGQPETDVQGLAIRCLELLLEIFLGQGADLVNTHLIPLPQLLRGSGLPALSYGRQ